MHAIYLNRTLVGDFRIDKSCVFPKCMETISVEEVFGWSVRRSNMWTSFKVIQQLDKCHFEKRCIDCVTSLPLIYTYIWQMKCHDDSCDSRPQSFQSKAHLAQMDGNGFLSFELSHGFITSYHISASKFCCK